MPMRPIPIRLHDSTIARLDVLARQRAELAGVDVTRSDAARLAVSAGLDVLLDGKPPVSTPHGRASENAPESSTRHGGASVPLPEAQPPAPARLEGTISDVAERFPCLRGLPGVRPFDVAALTAQYDRAWVGIDEFFLDELDSWPKADELAQDVERSDDEADYEADHEATRRNVHLCALIPLVAAMAPERRIKARDAERLRRLRSKLDLRLVRFLDAEHRAALADWFLAPRMPPMPPSLDR